MKTIHNILIVAFIIVIFFIMVFSTIPFITKKSQEDNSDSTSIYILNETNNILRESDSIIQYRDSILNLNK